MHERRQPERAQVAKSQTPEMPAFVAAEHAAQNLLGEPPIERPPLAFIVHVFEVVIEERDVADALLQRVGRDGAQQPRAFTRTSACTGP